jgi:hypothetical protein
VTRARSIKSKTKIEYTEEAAEIIERGIIV